jgi:general secretion pathway protein J
MRILNSRLKAARPGRDGRGAFSRSSGGIASRAGFTLMEVVLAVAVAAVALIAVNSVFFGALRLRNAATRSLESSLSLQRALGIIERDLANLVPPGGAIGGTLQSRSDFGALRGQLSPDFFTASARLEEDYPWGEAQRVSYVLIEPATNNAVGMDLYRAVTRNVLAIGTQDPEYEWLLSGVEDLRFEFHDGNQWLAEWDSTTAETPLPAAIRVELQLAAVRGRELPMPIQLVVPLFVDGKTNSAESATAGGGETE